MFVFSSFFLVDGHKAESRGWSDGFGSISRVTFTPGVDYRIIEECLIQYVTAAGPNRVFAIHPSQTRDTAVSYTFVRRLCTASIPGFSRVTRLGPRGKWAERGTGTVVNFSFRQRIALSARHDRPVYTLFHLPPPSYYSLWENTYGVIAKIVYTQTE